MDSFSDALSYPMEREEWYMIVLIGGVLSLLAFLILPILIVNGYVVRVIRFRLAGDPEPPAFEEWGTLLVDGIQVLIISIAYMLVPLIVAGITVGGSILALATRTDAGNVAALAGAFGGLSITFLLVLVFGYVAVVAIMNFAREEDLGAAFSFDTIRDVALNAEYAVAFGISILVFIGASVISGVLNVVPLLGAILSAFVFFYAEMVAAYLWADGFAEATGVETPSPTP